MPAKQEIEKELQKLQEASNSLFGLCRKLDDIPTFGTKYQQWYTRASKIVALLGPDRLEEFRSYYLIDPKRKSVNASNYNIQDYVKGIGAPTDYHDHPYFDIHNVVSIRLLNQVQIVQSLEARLEGVIADVQGHLLAELQDGELKAAQSLVTVSLRAAGALAGVVLERHLQRVARNHAVKLSRRKPTISNLNDALRAADIYDLPTWRKIQLLGDTRNICSHNKEREPTKQEVEELISGVNTIIKSVF